MRLTTREITVFAMLGAVMYASKLLMELMRLGKERGAFAYTLEVRVSNQAAIHLYEGLGFIPLASVRIFMKGPGRMP